ADTINVTNLDNGLSGVTVTINAGGGADTVSLANANTTSTPTTMVFTNAGNDVVNVSANRGNTTINTGAGATDTVNLGFTAPGQAFGQGTLSGIGGTVNVTDAGDGLTLMVDDFTDLTSDPAVTFTSSSIAGASDLGGTIGYTNVSTLNYNLPNVA